MVERVNLRDSPGGCLWHVCEGVWGRLRQWGKTHLHCGGPSPEAEATKGIKQQAGTVGQHPHSLSLLPGCGGREQLPCTPATSARATVTATATLDCALKLRAKRNLSPKLNCQHFSNAERKVTNSLTPSYLALEVVPHFTVTLYANLYCSNLIIKLNMELTVIR